MAVGRSSHSKWLCSCSLSLPCPTSAYFTYTLLAGLTSPPPCPTAQVTIAYQTADEESTPQLVSAISCFCGTVGLGAHEYGFLSAHVCVVRARLCASVVCACVLVWASTCMCGCPSGCMGACLRMCLHACVRVWVHVWVRGCMHECTAACLAASMCKRVPECMRAWVPVCVGACMLARVCVQPCLSL